MTFVPVVVRWLQNLIALPVVGSSLSTPVLSPNSTNAQTLNVQYTRAMLQVPQSFWAPFIRIGRIWVWSMGYSNIWMWTRDTSGESGVFWVDEQYNCRRCWWRTDYWSCTIDQDLIATFIRIGYLPRSYCLNITGQVTVDRMPKSSLKSIFAYNL